MHLMYCDDPWFSKIQAGIKRVEGRKGTPKHRQVKVGDRILFKCDDRQFIATVIRVDIFDSLDDYLNTVTLKEALPGIKTLEEGRQIYYQWSTPEEISHFGFLGIWIEV